MENLKAFQNALGGKVSIETVGTYAEKHKNMHIYLDSV